MVSRQLGVIEKYLHPNAARLAREQVNEFASSLLLLAKSLAYQRGDDEVLSTHIQEALNIIRSRRKERHRKELLIASGGALFGFFVSGFVTELLSGHSKVVLAFYVLAGILGLTLVFSGLQE